MLTGSQVMIEQMCSFADSVFLQTEGKVPGCPRIDVSCHRDIHGTSSLVIDIHAECHRHFSGKLEASVRREIHLPGHLVSVWVCLNRSRGWVFSAWRELHTGVVRF